MKKFFTLFICVLSIISYSTSRANNNLITLAQAADFSELIKNDKVVVLFIYPPGQPCKNTLAAMTKVAKEDASTTFIVVDIRLHANLRNEYRIGGIPALVFFKNGSERARATGQRDANALKALMAKAFLGAKKAFIANPFAYTTAWIKGHFTTNPICENQ